MRKFYVIMLILFTVVVQSQEKIDKVSRINYSKQFDESTTVECVAYFDDLYYYWEFKLKGTENRTIDKFRISKKELTAYLPYAYSTSLYAPLFIIEVFRDDHNNLIFYLDKFGQVDIHKYTARGEKEVIRVNNYELTTLEFVYRTEEFTDVKILDNVIYSLSEPTVGLVNTYRFNKIDLNTSTAYTTSINPFRFSNVIINEFDESKVFLTLDSGQYKYNGYGYRFFITSDDKVRVFKSVSKDEVYKLNFELSKPEEKNVNDLIEWDSSLF